MTNLVNIRDIIKLFNQSNRLILMSIHVNAIIFLNIQWIKW